MNKGPQFLLAALGLAAVSAAIILASHIMWLRPVWSYAPLTPDSLPASLGRVPDGEDFARYHTMLLGAIAAAGLGFNAWLVGLWIISREPQPPVMARWRMVSPALLLIPCAIHYWGMRDYNSSAIRVNQEWILKYRTQRRATLRLARPTELSVQKPENRTDVP